MRFYHCPENSISPNSLRQLPLCNPTKTAYWEKGTQDPGHFGGTLRRDPTVGPSNGTVGWDAKMNDKIKV